MLNTSRATGRSFPFAEKNKRVFSISLAEARKKNFAQTTQQQVIQTSRMIGRSFPLFLFASDTTPLSVSFAHCITPSFFFLSFVGGKRIETPHADNKQIL